MPTGARLVILLSPPLLSFFSTVLPSPPIATSSACFVNLTVHSRTFLGFLNGPSSFFPCRGRALLSPFYSFVECPFFSTQLPTPPARKSPPKFPLTSATLLPQEEKTPETPPGSLPISALGSFLPCLEKHDPSPSTSSFMSISIHPLSSDPGREGI